FLERGVLRIIRVLRFLFRVQVIKIAEELVKSMDSLDELVAVAKMVLAELPGCVALCLEQVGDGGILFRKPSAGNREANLQQPGTDRRLARNARRATGSAA